MITVILIHFALAIILFFLINLLGHHTPSSYGYYQLTTFAKIDEAPAFNYVVRVITPTVYLIVISALFYSVNLDRFVVGIYAVSIYYVMLRVLFNILTNRTKLINWKRHIVYSISITLLSWFIYLKFIKIKSNILPDWNNMANELWIVIIVFLYTLINNIQFSDKKARKRKNNYIHSRFKEIKRKYGKVISMETGIPRLQQLAYAIIIYESFNRPKIFRWIEYIMQFFSRKPHTLGIMQVFSKNIIGDKESVRLGTRKLVADFEALKAVYLKRNVNDDQYFDIDRTYQTKLVEKYNPDGNYSYEILSLADDLSIKFFDKTNNLFSNTPTYPE